MNAIEKKDSVEAIKELIHPILNSFGFELVDLEYKRSGPQWLLRIFIDKKGGVSLTDCETASRHISQILDIEDVIPRSYTLEVSSPGLDRPLKRIDDYQREKGKLVRINTFKPINNQRTFVGRVLDIEDNILKIADKNNGEIKIPLNDIAKAKLEIEF